MSIDVHVDISGPIHSDRAPEIVRDIVDKVAKGVGDKALANVAQRLDQVIRHPTPYYETQINLLRQGAADYLVNDRGIIYGPWLEGIGSRNSPATRFPGYFTFRQMTQKTDGEAGAVAREIVDKEIERLR